MSTAVFNLCKFEYSYVNRDDCYAGVDRSRLLRVCGKFVDGGVKRVIAHINYNGYADNFKSLRFSGKIAILGSSLIRIYLGF